MKTLRLHLVLTLFYFVYSYDTRAQLAINTYSYKDGIGLRAGGTSGLTYKHFLTDNTALEGILGLWNHGFSITGLYEKYAPSGVEGLRWYYGAGAHITVNNDGYKRYWYNGEKYWIDRDEFGIGIDGVIGLEYKIQPIPFALSLDLKPMIEVGSAGNIYWGLDPGLGIKVTF